MSDNEHNESLPEQDDTERLEQEQKAASQRITELSQKAYQFLKEDFITEAEQEFRKILEVDPENNYALVGLGDAARKKKEFIKAVDYYQRCLESHPDNNYALFGLADCYKSMRHYNRAIKIWEKYLQYDDENVTVLTRVADAYRKVRDLPRSKELYMRVLEMEADNPYALIGLGHLHYDFKEYEKALAYWGRMYDLGGENSDIRVLTSIGNCHRKLKTFEEGIPYFKIALERDPNNFYALFGLADCHRGLNQPLESLEYWDRILARDPGNKVILTRAGDAYRGMGKLEMAEMYYNKALNIEFDTYAVIGLALINKAKGNHREAIQSLEGILKSEAKNHRVYTEIADSYLKIGEPHNALEILNRFNRLGIRNRYVIEMIEKVRAKLNDGSGRR